MASVEVFDPLKPDQCRLMPEELVDLYNKLADQFRTVKLSIPRLARHVEELSKDLARVRTKLMRQHYQVGIMGRTGIGKSTTVKAILNCRKEDAPSQEGNGEATTSTITRIRFRRQGGHGLTLRYLTEERYKAKRNAMCKAVGGLDPEWSDQEILARLPEREQEIASGKRSGDDKNKALAEDPRFLRRLIESRREVRLPIPDQSVNYRDRASYLSHDPKKSTGSAYMLVEEAVIDFETAELPTEIEAIDLPGLGAHVSMDTIVTKEFLKELDGALVFIESKHRSDESAETLLAELRDEEVFGGKFEGRVWLVFTYFDGLGTNFIEGTHLGDTVFDGIVRLAKDRHNVPLEQVLLVSNYVRENAAREPNGQLNRMSAASIIGVRTEPPIPPPLQKYPKLVPAYEAVFDEGGISRLRQLLNQTLPESVAAKLRNWIRERIGNLATQLRQHVEWAELTSGADVLPKVQACKLAVYRQLEQIEGQTTFFTEAATQLRTSLTDEFHLRFPPDEYMDSKKTFEEIAKQFPYDTAALEGKLDQSVRKDLIPLLYGRVGEAFKNLDAIPVGGHESAAKAWRACQENDASDLAPWKGPLFPTFLAPDLFLGPWQANGRAFTGKQYRELMHAKISASTFQTVHVLRMRIRKHLLALDQELSQLVYKDDALNQPATGVDYQAIIATLRPLCQST